MRSTVALALLVACCAGPETEPDPAPSSTPAVDVTGILTRVAAAREKGDPDTEMAALDDLLAVRSDDLAARIRLGRLQVDAQLYAAAIDNLERAIELGGDERSAAMPLAHALQNLGRFDRAIAVLERMKARREAPDPGVRLGWLRMVRGDRTGAEAEFREALDGWPMSTGARIGLGTLLNRVGRHAEARAILEEAIELHARDPQVHYQLALTCRALGDEAAATAAMARFEKLGAGSSGPSFADDGG